MDLNRSGDFPCPQATLRILLVEDNEPNRNLLTDFLRNWAGFEVVALDSGSKFATTMQQFQPHLILLDLKLPDVDGYTLLQGLQNHPEWQQIPVIVVSACAFRSDRQRAMSLGVRQYLVKPVGFGELEQAIYEELSLRGCLKSCGL
jgi:two-component system cell cycle response regulator DivK